MLGHITDPQAEGGLDRRELPDPVPGDHDVLIRVAAYAVNRGELSLLEQRPDGWLPGQDLAGTLARAAADGTGPPEGARVVGVADGGAWSELAVVPSHRVAVLPDEVDVTQAAALPVAGLTALRTLRTGGPLLGAKVLVTGATGGVGTFALQLAVAAGANVTALVSRPERAEGARALGAHEVVTELGEETGPFDLVLEGVGGQVLVDAIRRLAAKGTVTAYGMAGGQQPAPLAFYDFAAGGGQLGRLIGFFIYATGEETFGEDLGMLAGLVADGRLRVDSTVRDWSETRAALQDFRDRRISGKLVLTL
ncbi:MAG TPA: zinc-binding dehydrogenase [Thermoleophilaceae bacterium]|jgi:NADPH:quinone reductase-like Zn-dependent oxidoreductase